MGLSHHRLYRLCVSRSSRRFYSTNSEDVDVSKPLDYSLGFMGVLFQENPKISKHQKSGDDPPSQKSVKERYQKFKPIQSQPHNHTGELRSDPQSKRPVRGQGEGREQSKSQSSTGFPQNNQQSRKWVKNQDQSSVPQRRSVDWKISDAAKGRRQSRGRRPKVEDDLGEDQDQHYPLSKLEILPKPKEIRVEESMHKLDLSALSNNEDIKGQYDHLMLKGDADMLAALCLSNNEEFKGQYDHLMLKGDADKPASVLAALCLSKNPAIDLHRKRSVLSAINRSIP